MRSLPLRGGGWRRGQHEHLAETLGDLLQLRGQAVGVQSAGEERVLRQPRGAQPGERARDPRVGQPAAVRGRGRGGGGGLQPGGFGVLSAAGEWGGTCGEAENCALGPAAEEAQAGGGRQWRAAARRRRCGGWGCSEGGGGGAPQASTRTASQMPRPDRRRTGTSWGRRTPWPNSSRGLGDGAPH